MMTACVCVCVSLGECETYIHICGGEGVGVCGVRKRCSVIVSLP